MDEPRVLVPVRSTSLTTLDPAILAGQLAPSSIAMYRRDVTAYLTWCQAAGLPADEPPSLARWLAHLAAATDYSPHTINRMLAAVKRLVKAAATQGYLDADRAEAFAAIAGVRPLALKARLRPHTQTAISKENMRQLCEAPDLGTLIGLRDAALLHTLASTGARVREIVMLEQHAIRAVGADYVITVQGKTDVEPRDVGISPEAVTAITTWLAARPVDSAYVFTSFAGRGMRLLPTPLSSVSAWRLVQAYAAAVGLAHLKPHDFRRFCLTRLIETHDLGTAQRQAGHRDIKTTARYDTRQLRIGATNNLY